MTDPWTYLANNGPSPAHKLPSRPTPDHRADGVTKFTLTGSKNSAISLHGKPTAVYYIENKHPPDSVLRAFMKYNPTLVDKLSDRALHIKIVTMGERFREASNELLGPFRSWGPDNPTNGHNETWQCPLCGDILTVKQRTHHLTGHP